jgi:hypothetical protein
MSKTNDCVSPTFTIDELTRYPGLVRDIKRKDYVFTELAHYGIISRPVTELFSVDLSNL